MGGWIWWPGGGFIECWFANPGNHGKNLNEVSINANFLSVAVKMSSLWNPLERIAYSKHVPCAVAQAHMCPASRQELFALPKTPGQSDDRHLQMNLAQWNIPAHCLGREKDERLVGKTKHCVQHAWVMGNVVNFSK